jgi:hypothetical protein
MDKSTENRIIEFLIGHPNIYGFNLLELAMMGTGFLLWTIAYYHIILDGRKNPVNEMPMMAAAGNIAWEFLWAFVFRKTPIGVLFNVGCLCWFSMDLFINYQVLTKNRKQEQNQWIKKNWVLIYIFSFIGYLITLFFMAEDGADNALGIQSALLLNVLMSALYIYQMVENPQFEGRDYTERIAYLKMLGTGVIIVASYMIWPKNYYIAAMGLTCIIMDFVYLTMFWKYRLALLHKQRLQREHPEQHHDLLDIHEQLQLNR